MKKKSIVILFLFWHLIAVNVEAKIWMPAIFADGMVLQQQSRVAVWGSSDKEKGTIKLKTSWNKKFYTVRTDVDGKWKMQIDTPEYGGPFQIEVSDGEKRVLNDIWIGEVWLCSGQSNMEMKVGGRKGGDFVDHAMEAIAVADNPRIRMFTVPITMKSEPQLDCGGTWQPASMQTIPEFSATAYFFALKLNKVLGVPVGIIHVSCGGSRIEAWMSPEEVAPYKGNPDVKNPSILYNGMMAPLVGYGIRGCLWYQGEANVDAPKLYRQLFPDFVKDWRKQWGEEFPFYYAQIAPFNYGNGQESAYLREAQRVSQKVIPSSGMIVLMDVGDVRTIHPRNKKTVGDRFAYMALGKIYGKGTSIVTGPMYQSMVKEENRLILSFEETGLGLTSKHQTLTDFEVCGEDKVFYPAQARFGKDTQTVILFSPKVKNPVAARYAFKNYVTGSLFNMMGFPASSFCTDEW